MVSDIGIELLGFHAEPWRPEDRAAVVAVIDHPHGVSRRDLGRLDMLIGRRFGEAVLAACRACDIDVSTLDAVASHGTPRAHAA